MLLIGLACHRSQENESKRTRAEKRANDERQFRQDKAKKVEKLLKDLEKAKADSRRLEELTNKSVCLGLALCWHLCALVAHMWTACLPLPLHLPLPDKKYQVYLDSVVNEHVDDYPEISNILDRFKTLKVNTRYVASTGLAGSHCDRSCISGLWWWLCLQDADYDLDTRATHTEQKMEMQRAQATNLKKVTNSLRLRLLLLVLLLVLLLLTLSCTVEPPTPLAGEGNRDSV